MDERIIKTIVRNNTYWTNPKEKNENNYVLQKQYPLII